MAYSVARTVAGSPAGESLGVDLKAVFRHVLVAEAGRTADRRKAAENVGAHDVELRGPAWRQKPIDLVPERRVDGDLGPDRGRARARRGAGLKPGIK